MPKLSKKEKKKFEVMVKPIPNISVLLHNLSGIVRDAKQVHISGTTKFLVDLSNGERYWFDSDELIRIVYKKKQGAKT